MGHLKQLLDDQRCKYDNVWIMAESLYSMDGDFAPLAELVELKQRYDAYLYLDEAHAVACMGSSGLGLSEALGLSNSIDLLIGTFGKALAVYGGFVTGSHVLMDTIENFARPWIFSTSLPPIVIDWNQFIWNKLPSLAGSRTKLQQSANTLRKGLKELGQSCLGESYIVPLLKPGNANVMALSKKLQSAEILALPIRSPTVAKGTERIRFSLSAEIPPEEIQRCLKEIMNAL